MANDTAENLTQKEGLIKYVEKGRGQQMPKSSSGSQVIALQNLGKEMTRPVDSGRPLTISERFWGKYTFCIVNTQVRQLKVEDSFPTHDRVFNVHVAFNVRYQVTNAEKVALAEDPLSFIRDYFLFILRTKIAEMPLETLQEQQVKNVLDSIPSWRDNPDYLDVGISLLGAIVTKFEPDRALVDHWRKKRELDLKRELEIKESERREEILKLLGLENDSLARFIIHSKQDDIGRLAEGVGTLMQTQGAIDSQRYNQYIQLFNTMVANNLIEQDQLTGLVTEITEGLKDRRHDIFLQQVLLSLKPKEALGSGNESGGRENPSTERDSRDPK